MATRSKHAQRSKRNNKKHEAMLNVFAQISGRYAHMESPRIRNTDRR